MSHAVITRNLGRNKGWRKATVQSLTQALFKRERINTTWPRAKETQRLAERLITLGKANTLAARRRAISLLNDPDIVARLFSDLSPRFTQRNGGYTRVIRNGYRSGDGAPMAVLELVELAPKLKEKKPKGKEKQVQGPQEQAPAAQASGAPPPGMIPGMAPPVSAPEAPAPEAPKKDKKVEEPKEVKPKGPKKAKEPRVERPKGFLGGLRRFFRKDRPK